MIDLTGPLYAAARRAGLLVPATVGDVEVFVHFRAPDEAILDGLALGRDYAITFRTAELADLKAGDEVSMNGVNYRVREVVALRDGSESRATMSRV